MDFARLADHLTRHFQRTREAPFAVRVDPREIRAHLRDRYAFASPTPLDAVFDDLTAMMWKWTEHGNNPRHVGLFRPGVDPTCVIAETLAAAYDANLATWNFAPAANEIERHTLAFLMRRFGLDPDIGIAQFTSGGQESNHTAVIAALTQAFPKSRAKACARCAGGRCSICHPRDIIPSTKSRTRPAWAARRCGSCRWMRGYALTWRH